MLSSTLKDVMQPQRQKSIREKELKDKMIITLTDKIKNYSKYNQTSCLFKVPPFLLGYIPYNHQSMVNYIKSKLYKEGFFVKEQEPYTLYISWDVKDVQKVQDSKKKEKLKEININNDLKSFASTKKLSLI